MTMRKLLSGSLFSLVGLFLVDASYTFDGASFPLVRALLVGSVFVVTTTVAVMLHRRLPITLTLPSRPKLSFKEKFAQMKQLRRAEDEEARKERLAYQRSRMVRKLGKAHDVSFYTWQHLNVQQNFGFLKR